MTSPNHQQAPNYPQAKKCRGVSVVLPNPFPWMWSPLWLTTFFRLAWASVFRNRHGIKCIAYCGRYYRPNQCLF